MTTWARREYTGIAELRGPLLVVRGVDGVGWDEFAEIRMENRQTRHGLLLDADRDLAVVQVLEGTGGMRTTGTRVAFSGSPLRIPVGDGWLGWVYDGRGDPVDGGPPVTGEVSMPVAGFPINPVLREPPADPVLTGISVIDALTTLVRGQKLPLFSVAGLPHLELAAQLAAQASAGGEPFCVVFAAIGLTHADAAAVRAVLQERSAAGQLVLLLNLADDPVIERILTPRLALTVAERLAFTLGRHVLVVMADMTSYCEALREVSAARGEVPARRAYPGYLYSDLASLYERCGRIRGSPGSVTVVPVLTMPAGDIAHPVPDLTGYITEGQIVLSPEIHSRGVYPPVDALSSLSRLMRHGAGLGRTREDHLDVAAQTWPRSPPRGVPASWPSFAGAAAGPGGAALADQAPGGGPARRRPAGPQAPDPPAGNPGLERIYAGPTHRRRGADGRGMGPVLPRRRTVAAPRLDARRRAGDQAGRRRLCRRRDDLLHRHHGRPAPGRRHLPHPRVGDLGRPAMAAAREAHGRALEAAVRHAAAAAALQAVEAETLATRYRLRAVRDRWIPRLEQALAEVTFALEEQELADSARLRLAAFASPSAGSRRRPTR